MVVWMKKSLIFLTVAIFLVMTSCMMPPSIGVSSDKTSNVISGRVEGVAQNAVLVTKDYEVRGVIFVRSKVQEDRDKNRTGSKITFEMLMREAQKLGADDVINVRIDVDVKEFRTGYRLDYVTYEYTATALAIKYGEAKYSEDKLTETKNNNARVESNKIEPVEVKNNEMPQSFDETKPKSQDVVPLTHGGQTYRTVIIGGKRWMAENLNYQTGKSWCYGNNPDNCKKYGRLYDWNTAMSVCPAGWRLPTRQDWNDLVVASGGNRAGTRLKAGRPDWDGMDDFGFSALPGGYRHANGDFGSVGSYGYWWTVVEGGNGAYIRGMGSGVENVGEGTNGKTNGNSVRCLQDMRQ